MAEDKLAASTAILAAVSAATLASNAPASTDEVKREFGTAAYERVLPEGDCRCVERTNKRLQALDSVVHVWVRDARSFRHGMEGSVPYFSLRVVAAIPVSELRSLVQEHFARLSSYQREVDGELQLGFDDWMLDDGETFAAYLPGGEITSSVQKRTHSDATSRRQPSWPKPFAGILWVLPWRPSRKLPLQWGSGEASAGRTQPGTAKETQQEQHPQQTM